MCLPRGAWRRVVADVKTIAKPHDLAGARIGLSVSDSPDLARRGLVETHLRLVLAEIARAMLLTGAALAYGGRIDTGGYTNFLRKELQKYGRRDQPLLVCLALSEHRAMSLDEIEAAEIDLGLYGELVCLDSRGKPIDPREGRGVDPEPVDQGEIPAVLTGMRRFMATQIDARVLIGGRRSDYQGFVPGLVEEASLAIETGQPLYLVGGFGGICSDIARLFGFDPDGALPAMPGSDPDPEVKKALGGLANAAREAGWHAGANGLSLKQNCQLAASHRPGEVASLISTGLRSLIAENESPLN